MVHVPRYRWSVGLAIGLILGLIVGGLWPDTPLHATATDRAENFAIATGFVDDDIEAVYFLDFLTGTLRVAVVSNQRQGFQAKYEANINQDLAGVVQYINAGGGGGGAVQLPQTPNYLMVTGRADLRRGPGARHEPGRSLVYVAETNTGILLAYAVPWNRSFHQADQPSGGRLILWAGDRFSTAIKRPE